MDGQKFQIMLLPGNKKDRHPAGPEINQAHAPGFKNSAEVLVLRSNPPILK
jgi:hypothetical protein